MKLNVLLLSSALILSSCGNNGGGESNPTLGSSTNKYAGIIAKYEELKGKENKSSKDKIDLKNLQMAYQKGKALGKRGIKFNKGDNIFPQQIVEDQPYELFIVDENGEEVSTKAWFKSDAPEVSIIQAMDGGAATITASEPGTYEVKAHVRKHPLDKKDMDKEYREFKNGHKHKTISAFITVEEGTPPDPCADVLGDGSPANPYQANNFRQLVCMYSNGYVWQDGTNIKLGFDVDLRSQNFDGNVISFGYWRANLDGNGHTIQWDAPQWDCDTGVQEDGSWGNGIPNEFDDTCYDGSAFRRVDNGTFTNINIVIGDVNAPNFLNVGGLVGNTWNASFENITVEYIGTVFSDDQRGGFAGFLDGPTDVKNIWVNNFRVESCASERDEWTGGSGGLTSYFGFGSIENVTIDGVFIDCPNGNHNGFIASVFNEGDIKNVTVSNVEINGDNSGINGFINGYDSGGTVDNVTLNNIKLSGNNSRMAGFIESLGDVPPVIKNINVNNVEMRGDNSGMAGFVQYANGGGKIENINVNNIKAFGQNSNASGFFGSIWNGIDVNNATVEGFYARVYRDQDWGVISGFSDGLDGNVQLVNINVSEVDIETSGSNAVGFVLNALTSYGRLNIDGVNINDVNIVSLGGGGDFSPAFGSIGLWDNSGEVAEIKNVQVSVANVENRDQNYNWSVMGGFASNISGNALIGNVNLQFVDLHGGVDGYVSAFVGNHYNGKAELGFIREPVIDPNTNDITFDQDGFVIYKDYLDDNNNPLPGIAGNINVRDFNLSTSGNAAVSSFLNENHFDAHTVAKNFWVESHNLNISGGSAGAISRIVNGVAEFSDGEIGFMNYSCMNVWECSLGFTYGEGDLTVKNLRMGPQMVLQTSGSAGTGGVFSSTTGYRNLDIDGLIVDGLSIETFNGDYGWEAVGILIGTHNHRTADQIKLRNIEVFNSNAQSHSNDPYHHRMMGGLIAHLYTGAFTADRVKITNSQLLSDYYSISGGILGEISIGEGSGSYNCSIHDPDPDSCGRNLCEYKWNTNTCESTSVDQIYADRLSSLNNEIRTNIKGHVYGENDWQDNTINGQIFGRIGSVWNEAQQISTRGTIEMNDVVANGTFSNFGIGSSWEAGMITLNNSLYVDQSLSGSCSISNVGSGEQFIGSNNYGLYCNDGGQTTEVDGADSALQTSYPGFDFTNVWEIRLDQNIEHPTLQ